MKKLLLTIILTGVIFLLSSPATVSASTSPTPTPTPFLYSGKIKSSKFLVFDNTKLTKEEEAALTREYIGYQGGDYTNFRLTFKKHYANLDRSNKEERIYVYEFIKRPKYAGKARSVTLSDNDLLPENLLKYNLMVGDIVTTESIEYEQDGNTENGKEPIKWVVDKVQYLYTIYPSDVSLSYVFSNKPGYRQQGANFTAKYFFRAVNTLDYDEYFKVVNCIELYTGSSLNEQEYNTTYNIGKAAAPDDMFVFDPLEGVDINFMQTVRTPTTSYFWNTSNTTLYTGIISLYHSEGKSMKSKPTAYALSKGIPVTSKGYSKLNWIYGVDPYVENGIEYDYAGLTVSYDGKSLYWNDVFYDKAGFRPEMTLVTGVDTARKGEKYDLYITEQKDGSWRKKYEINYDIWKPYDAFTRWKIE